MNGKLVALLLVLVLSGSARAAVPEAPMPQVQATPSLSVAPTQPGKPAWLTPEKEAALVEVRKILLEARQVAENIRTPTPILSDRHRRKALERRKDELLRAIEEAQLLAGDITITPTSEGRIGFRNDLALAQARYGFTKEAVQTASSETLTGDSLLLLIEALVKSGDFPAAFTLADIQLPKDGVELWRQKVTTEVFSYIAEEQYKAGDLKARETLNRAIKGKPSSRFSHTIEYIQALIYLGRAQAVLGEKAASAGTFKRAIDAAVIRRKGGNFSGLLPVIARAQAEAGDRASSELTFQRAIELRTSPRDLTCLAWAQAVSGQRDTALQSFKLAIEDAEKLPLEEQSRALSDLVPWQLEIGDRAGAADTVERARRIGAFDVIRLAGRNGNWKLALDQANALSDDSRKAGALAYIARTLSKTKDPFGTPEVFKQLADAASALQIIPRDRSDTDHMFKNIAVTQAAAGDLFGAQKTIANISLILQDGAYAEIVNVRIDKGDLSTAGRVLAGLKEDWRPFTDSFRKLGAAYVYAGETGAGIGWARQQQNLYEKANALLGVAESVLRLHDIQRQQVPEFKRRNFCPDLNNYDL